MLRISQLTTTKEEQAPSLEGQAAKLLGIAKEDIRAFRIVRQSIDARKKPKIFWVYTVELEVNKEERLLKRLKNPRVTRVEKNEPYVFPSPLRKSAQKPVIVGMGPAGLFAALFLARAGIPSILLERGRDVDQRSLDVEAFWKTGKLSPHSNVQFGEGGAGTFSDGKLSTGTHDPRIQLVLETLVEFGAPPEILYSHKPHVGTDVLRTVVKQMRLALLDLGCQVYFQRQMTGLVVENGRLAGVEATDRDGCVEAIRTDALILAPGHSARDTFRMLSAQQLNMEQKPFAIGVRIEHKQAAVSAAQFGKNYETMPPTDYKLSCHLPNGRSAFSFCVCPGGQVIAAASESGQLVTNGMSKQARDGENINGGFLVGVGPGDYPGDDALAGVRFQEQWEQMAWELGGRNFRAPAQLVGDFLAGRPSTQGGSITPSYQPGVTFTDLRACLPDYVADTLAQALPIFDRKVKGFAHPDAVMTGVETRSSSPLRIVRDKESLEASLPGLYPCGEGAGYAGGIMSAAVDGIRVAQALSMKE